MTVHSQHANALPINVGVKAPAHLWDYWQILSMSPPLSGPGKLTPDLGRSLTLRTSLPGIYKRAAKREYLGGKSKILHLYQI
jgi:hypothetical protein